MTCREVVLHVGMHKTGSSSIQSSLHEFDDGRVRYAHLGAANQSTSFVNVFSKTPELNPTNITHGYSPTTLKNKREKLIRKMQLECETNRDILVFSGEDISLLEVDEVEAIAKFFFSRHISVRIIAYIRDPISFASSAFTQIVRGGHPGDRIPMPAYRFRFQKFFDLFGEDSITLIPYNKEQLKNHSVVQDFCHRLDIAVTNNGEVTTNISNSKSVIQLLYLLNNSSCITSGSTRLLQSRQKLTELLNTNFKGSPLKLPTEILNLSKNKADFAWMAEKLPGWTALEQVIDNSVAREVQLDLLREYMHTLEPSILPTLQNLVAEKDPLVAKSQDTVGLVNHLFHEIHFRKKPIKIRTRAALRKIGKKVAAKI